MRSCPRWSYFTIQGCKKATSTVTVTRVTISRGGLTLPLVVFCMWPIRIVSFAHRACPVCSLGPQTQCVLAGLPDDTVEIQGRQGKTVWNVRPAHALAIRKNWQVGKTTWLWLSCRILGFMILLALDGTRRARNWIELQLDLVN